METKKSASNPLRISDFCAGCGLKIIYYVDKTMYLP